jgi:hypothetical protein
MAKKKKLTPKDKTKINRVRKTTGATRKTTGRKMRLATKAQVAKAAPKAQLQQKAAGSNRAEGIRLFKLAGRPTKEQFILVYGERGPKMTWGQRAAAGVPAAQFQTALASAARWKK